MKSIKKIIDPNGLESVIDNELSILIKEKFVGELKSRWSQKLATKGIQRTKNTGKKNTNFILLAACAILLIASALVTNLLIKNSNPSIQKLSNQYALQDIKSNPNIVKGESTVDPSALQAGNAFNTQDWKSAQQLYGTLVTNNPKELDFKFYLALSYFYDSQYATANSIFSELNNNPVDGAKRQELNWFFGLSLIQNGDTKKGKQILMKISENDWNYTKAQSLLN